MNTPDVTPYVNAFKDKAWLLLGAMIVGLLVTLAKQGWVSNWISTKLTPRSTPYYALLLSALSAGSADIIAGKPLAQAIMDTLFTAFTAVAGHQFVVESIRRGKEFIPATDKVQERRINSTATPKELS